MPVAARSKAYVCGLSRAEIVGSNPAEDLDANYDCCMFSDVSVTSWSLLQRSPTDCGASLCET